MCVLNISQWNTGHIQYVQTRWGFSQIAAVSGSPPFFPSKLQIIPHEPFLFQRNSFFFAHVLLFQLNVLNCTNIILFFLDLTLWPDKAQRGSKKVPPSRLGTTDLHDPMHLFLKYSNPKQNYNVNYLEFEIIYCKTTLLVIADNIVSVTIANEKWKQKKVALEKTTII